MKTFKTFVEAKEVVDIEQHLKDRGVDFINFWYNSKHTKMKLL